MHAARVRRRGQQGLRQQEAAEPRELHEFLGVVALGIGRLERRATDEIVDRRQSRRLGVAPRRELHGREPHPGELQGQVIHAQFRIHEHITSRAAD